jgi:sugar lactone lactonase YvrE
MNKLVVYIAMATIVVVNAVVFGLIFINSTQALPTGLQGVAQNTPTKAVDQIYGSFDAPLERPMDVAVTKDYLYVTDTTGKKVHAISLTGGTSFHFGEGGNLPGQFDFPYGISVDQEGNIFVADMYNSQISIFDQQGQFIEFFADKYSKDGTLISPAGLRIIDDKVYVTDVDAHKVFVFNLNGDLLLQIGEEGVAKGQFLSPNGVTADEDGTIFVVDTVNERVQVFNRVGDFVRVIDGEKLDEEGSILSNPRGIGIDSKGNLHVVSNMTNFVDVFTKEGEHLHRMGGLGQEAGQLYLPNGLFIDKNDKIYVTDNLNLRISVFQ